MGELRHAGDQGGALVIHNDAVLLAWRWRFLHLAEILHGGFIQKLSIRRLRHRLPIDRNLLVQIGHFIAWQTHDALDVIKAGLQGIMKNDDISTLNGIALRHSRVEYGQTNAISKFIDQNQIVNAQRGNH